MDKQIEDEIKVNGLVGFGTITSSKASFYFGDLL
jgi:hypothetical protein